LSTSGVTLPSDIGVSATAPTATAEMTENARKMENIIRRIRAAGVVDRDVQTTGISLYPQKAVTMGTKSW
jgi:uncharacterized protein YggE